MTKIRTRGQILALDFVLETISDQGNISEFSIHHKEIVPKEKTLHKKQMQIKRFTRERRKTILNDFIVFPRNEDDIRLVKEDPINFHQVMLRDTS